MSSVCERQNKLMAEFHFRDLIKGRLCMCLEDNQGSVACINSGYANNVHLQAMQLASNLRQATDEAPMSGSYCNTHNMSWFDQTSRMEKKFCDKMNKELVELGMMPWTEEPPYRSIATIIREFERTFDRVNIEMHLHDPAVWPF